MADFHLFFINIADPCFSYTLSSGQYKRSTGYTLHEFDIDISDNFLSEGWHRFDSGAGNDMVTEAPLIYINVVPFSQYGFKVCPRVKIQNES